MCDRKCCMRPGRVTKNGYLNFLREFRKKHCEFSSATEMVQAGAKAWNRLTCEQKRRYKYLKARRSCRPRRRSGCRKRRRSGCRSRRRSSCRARRRSSCRSRRRSSCRSRRRRSSCGRRRSVPVADVNVVPVADVAWDLVAVPKGVPDAVHGVDPDVGQSVVAVDPEGDQGAGRDVCELVLLRETVKRGAKVWCTLPCRQRMKYERMARRAACGGGSRRRRRRC